MKKALDFAYNSPYPVLTFLVNWNLYSVNNRDGNIQEFTSRQAFVSYCKRNLKGKVVSYISAGNEITLTQAAII